MRQWLRRRLPEGLREVVGNRLEGLTEACNGALSVACLFDGGFTVRQLAGALDQTAEEVMAAVDEGVRARMVEPSAEGGERYRFAHAAELAVHFEAAQPLAGPERFARYALAAGRQSLETEAYEEAVKRLAAGREALEDRAMDELQAEILFAEGEALLPLGSQREAWDRLKRAFGFFEGSGNTVRAVAVAVSKAIDWRFLHWERDFFERASRLAIPDSVDAARLLQNYGWFLHRTGGTLESVSAQFEKAYAIAEARSDVSLRAQVLKDWGIVSYYFLDYEGSAEKTSRALELAMRNKDPYAEVSARVMLGWVLPLMGRGEEARSHGKAALEIAERLGGRSVVLDARIFHSFHGFQRGDWDTARALIDLYLADAPQTIQHVAIPLYLRVMIEHETGHGAEGNAYLERILEHMRSDPTASLRATAYCAFGILAAARATGDTRHLEVVRRTARGMLSENPDNLWSVQNARSFLAHIAWLTQDVELAREQYEALGSQPLGVDTYYLPTLRGIVARMIGKLDEAADHLQAVLKTASFTVLIQVWTSHELAETFFLRDGSGDRQRALSVWKEALEVAESKGLTRLAAQITVRLREASAGDAVSLPDGLSVREAEVLRLLAKGATNKEIASGLFISEKTVENHVSSILAKVKAGNRTEAAAYAHRHGLA